MTGLPAVVRGCGAALVGVALAAPAAAQDAGTASHRPRAAVLRAVRVSKPPVIDGQLNDEAWSLAAPAGGFTQQDPDEGVDYNEKGRKAAERDLRGRAGDRVRDEDARREQGPADEATFSDSMRGDMRMAIVRAALETAKERPDPSLPKARTACRA